MRRELQYLWALPAVRFTRLALSWLGLLAIGSGYAVALWKVPDLVVKGSTDAARDRHNARLLVVSAGGAIVVAIGLLFTWSGYRLSHRGQVTDRFTKALERLGSTEMDVRLGGIYALAHVAHDSPPHHNDVIEVLEAFIRRRAPAARHDDGPTLAARRKLSDRPEADVQAALTALGRRPRRPEHRRIDLSQLHLSGAQLSQLNLRRVNLEGADLSGAYLGMADLRNASLEGAKLSGTNLWKANLGGADLEGANLRDAYLGEADLRKAFLEGANLRDAYLGEADLRRANLGKSCGSAAKQSMSAPRTPRSVSMPLRLV
ncbi:pentapeptide repeat-containing protein [Actinomadura sp. 6N118]|uniref:pentapeptide repeat-containing protein n=1 Tax=Actinomadura sp. 6N118 TaxID=3375151 RepID=UPI0037B1632B